MFPSILICVLLSVPFLVLGEDPCGPRGTYSRLSTTHTACKPDNKQCRKLKAGISEKDKQLILSLHNQLRSRIASGLEQRRFGFPTAANMMQMEWDDELAYVAQAHANQCVFDHDCNECRASGRYGVGQNLGQSKSSAVNVVANWTSPIQAWYDEISLAHPSIVNKFEFQSKYGHFSQVVWANTWRIGCGFSTYPSTDRRFKTEMLYTCNYGPGGNIGRIGYNIPPMYRAGAPASRCPVNTRSSPSYPGLCKSMNSLGPQEDQEDMKQMKGKLVFNCDFGLSNRLHGRNFATDPWCGIKFNMEGDYIKNNSRLFMDNFYNYMQFKGLQGEKATMSLPGTYNNVCLENVERRTSSSAKVYPNSNLKVKINLPKYGQNMEQEVGGFSKQYQSSRFRISINQDMNLKLEFSVPQGSADEQVYEIKRISIREGDC